MSQGEPRESYLKEERKRVNQKLPDFDKEAKKQGFYDTQEKDEWKPCIKCGGELTQERKAFFVCINCKQEYIADEEDLRL